MGNRLKILIIEDDLDIQGLLVEYLESNGFGTKAFANPIEALDFLQNSIDIDLVVLDLMLPKMDGFDVCKKIRDISDIPIIISSARGNLSDKVVTFEHGADDYLAKPYEPKELLLRIDAIFRRIKRANPLKTIGDFSIDENKMEIFQDGYLLEFTPIEYQIFSALLHHPREPLSRESIALCIGMEPKDRTIDMHISNIRSKIFDDIKNPKYIKSIWGIGYKFIG